LKRAAGGFSDIEMRVRAARRCAADLLA
jgi:hypothetical protein